MSYKLKPLKAGYIRANKILSYLGKNQIKIGSKQYKTYTDFTKPERKKGLKALEKLESGTADIKHLRRTIRGNINWTPNQQLKAYKTIKAKLGNKPHLLYFKSGNNPDWSTKALTINNNDTLKNLVKTIGQSGIESEENVYGSDVFNQIQIEGVNDFKFVEIKKPTKLFNKVGSFFPHLNESNMNLEKYQILSSNSKETILSEHCLIYALKQYEIPYPILGTLMATFKSGFYFPKNRLYQVSEAIKRTICLYEYDIKKKKVRFFKYGKYNQEIKIGLFENHYFKYDINIEYNNIKYANIILLLIHLKKNNLFNIDFYKNRKEFIKYSDNHTGDLANLENEQKEFKLKQKEHKEKTIFYSDCESQCQHNEIQIPLSIGVMKNTDKTHEANVKIFSLEKDKTHRDFINNYFDYIIKNAKPKSEILIYFHNLKFDFHLLNDHLTLFKPPLTKDGQYYEVYIRYKKRLITLRDSFKFINRPLNDFNELLKLPENLKKKDGINYLYHTYNNYHIEQVDIKQYLKDLEEEHKETLKVNLSKHPLIFEYDEHGGTFNPKAYYEYYLKYDVMVLKEGMEKLTDSIKTITENNIYLHDYRTISSLSYQYAKIRGCLDNIYSICGNLRNFISKAQTGGRVIVNEEAKMRAFTVEMEDADINSLYGWAMANIPGAVVGPCSRIKTFNKATLDNYSYYVVKIAIYNIRKKQQLPIIGIKNKDGIIDYVNEISGTEILTVDKSTLNEYIRLHNIKYDIMDGVYWNQGFNNKLPILTVELYNKRLKYKQEDEEALQQTTKLIINSIYGKSGTAQNFTKRTLVEEQNVNAYIWNNFQIIKNVEKINNSQYIIEMNTTDESYNEAHLATMVLSKSKEVMNNLFNIANDNGLKIYYTDTDSIHISKQDLKTLQSEYKKTYGIEIIGKGLGLLSSDFKIKGCKDVKAVESIFIGKKIYYDKIQGINKKGEIVTKEHYRFKGTPQKALEYHARQHHGGSMSKLYKSIIQKKGIFNMIQNPIDKPKFEFKNYAVKVLEPRTVLKSFKF